MSQKSNLEIAVELVDIWLKNEAATSFTAGSTTTVGTSKSVKEISQAYIDFYNTVNDYKVPDNFESTFLEEN